MNAEEEDGWEDDGSDVALNKDEEEDEAEPVMKEEEDDEDEAVVKEENHGEWEDEDVETDDTMD